MEDEVEQHPVIHRRRWPVVAGVLLLMLGLVVLGLWLARKPIATGYADRWLARADVPVRYTIGNLGFGRQRLTGVVIGDPAQPDLVADWLETRTAWGLRGPYLAQVRGGHVRVRARWADGRLSLGSIDRLLPAPSGKPFALPALDIDVKDARARVATPWGVVGAKLSGRGRLDGGFDGQLALVSAKLGGTCAAIAPAAIWQVRTASPGLFSRARTVRLQGSAQAGGLACAGAVAGYTNTNGTVEIALGRTVTWSTRTDLAATALRHPGGSARTLTGKVELAGGGRGATGHVALQASHVAGQGLSAGRVTLDGNVNRAVARSAFDGTLNWVDTRWNAASLRRLAGAGQGTPVAPLLRQAAAGLTAAASRFGGEAAVNLSTGPDGTAVRVRRAALTSASGVRATLVEGQGAEWTATRGLLVNGTVRLGGGGLPTAVVRLAQAKPGALRGTAQVAPYAAADARLALTPVAFAQGGGSWRVTTEATLSGPLPNGRLDALTLPIDARWRGGALTLTGGCAPVSWARVAVSGLRIDRGAVRLCPTDEPLLTLAGGRIGGGASVAATRLTGRLGSTPATVALSGASVRLGTRGFAAQGVEARLGNVARVTRLSIGSLEGRTTSGGLAGTFARAGGQIGAVPLAMSEANGAWRFAGGALTLSGALAVADTAAPARFQPMAARGVTLRLAGNRIDVAGALFEPTTGTRVASLAIRHDLSAGSGTAALTVPGLTFAKAFQPELLTRLTFGIIADVRGTVGGEGRIGWSPAGVTSTGAFRTAGTDLAAAFGPVEGIAGEIRFTDLLALQSAPAQRLTVRSINPGIPVTDGVVAIQTLPGTRIQMEDARWPFAGGTLVLEPTLLDFSAAAQRRMTFRIAGAAADQFLQQFDFKNLDATGTFDGMLPMVFDASGGRIVDGRIAVRPGGGTLAYVGAVSQKNLGFWANFAFESLKSLRYRSLGIVMNGPLAGEMVTEVRFAGISQGQGAKSNFLIRRLQRLPFVFNIRIRAPFRGLLDSTASFYDPKRLIQRVLPQLIEQQRKSVQPSVSETKP